MENWLIIKTDVSERADVDILKINMIRFVDELYDTYNRSPLIQEIYYGIIEDNYTMCNKSHSINKKVKINIKSLHPLPSDALSFIFDTIKRMFNEFEPITYKQTSTGDVDFFDSTEKGVNKLGIGSLKIL